MAGQKQPDSRSSVPAGPHVVLTTPPPAPAPSELPSEVPPPVDTERTLEPPAVAEDDDRVSTAPTTPPPPPVLPSEPPLTLAKSEGFGATMMFGSQAAEPPVAASLGKSEPPAWAKSEPPAATKSEPPPAKKSEPPPRAKSEPPPAKKSEPPPGSVKRASDHGLEEGFFAEDVHHAPDVPLDEALTVQNKAARKAEPHVVERRERFARYVKWAVMGAGVVCLAAMVRTWMSPAEPPKTAPARAVPSETTAPAAPSTSVTAEPAPVPSATASTEPAPVPSATASTEPAASASAVTSASASAEPAAVVDRGSGDPKAEKESARKALEQRKLAAAIEAAQRSVALDPTDGEAWLILGAAFQEKGAGADARKAYASCVKEGKSGPVSECAKMLR